MPQVATPKGDAPSSSQSESAPLVLMDAHVLIYDCFRLDRFFDSARRNFVTRAGGDAPSVGPDPTAESCLTPSGSMSYQPREAKSLSAKASSNRIVPQLGMSPLPPAAPEEFGLAASTSAAGKPSTLHLFKKDGREQ